MRILVTGATGLIGCHTTARLIEAGHVVRVLVRDRAKLAKVLAPFGRGERDVEIAMGSVLDEAAVTQAFAGCEGLVHCAGIFSPKLEDEALIRATNVEGTRLVLECARGAGLSRAIYMSSILALFPPDGDRMTAADPVRTPRSMYAATKAEAERVARSYQDGDTPDPAPRRLPLTILYPAAVQGPHDPTFSVGPQLVADALESGRVLVTEGGLPSTDVRDLAALVVAVFEAKDPPPRLMAPAFFLPHDRYHALLEDLSGRTLGVRRVPGWLLRAMGRAGDAAGRLGRPVQLTHEAALVLTRSVPIDDREAREILGRDPIGPERSFADLIAWMLAAGHLAGERVARELSGGG